jgi:hypothetical protein
LGPLQSIKWRSSCFYGNFKCDDFHFSKLLFPIFSF